MSGYTERFSEVHYPLIKIAPAVKSPAGEVISSYVDAGMYTRFALVLHLGAIAATGTMLVRILQATSAAGANAKGIPTTAAQTKITSALVTGDANGIVVIELTAEELDVDGGFHFLAVGYDVDTDTVAMGAVLWGIEPRYAPVDSTGYNEIVT
jgi:hypothetical protein